MDVDTVEIIKIALHKTICTAVSVRIIAQIQAHPLGVDVVEVVIGNFQIAVQIEHDRFIKGHEPVHFAQQTDRKGLGTAVLTALQRKIIDLLPWDLLMRHFSILPLSFYPVYLIFRKKETIIWRKPEPRWQSMQDSGLCLCVHKS